MPGQKMSKLFSKSASRARKTETMREEAADLLAMSYGFANADELKSWGEEAERERLGELQRKNDGPVPSGD